MELLEGTVTVDDIDAFVETLGEIGDRHSVTIQAFDARYIAGERHLERAVELADRAFERGENTARERAVEILLYAAGRRQINQALEMGLSEGPEQQAVILVDGEETDADEAGALKALSAMVESKPSLEAGEDARLRAFFEITDAELAATDAPLEALVCERVALLEVEQ